MSKPPAQAELGEDGAKDREPVRGGRSYWCQRPRWREHILAACTT